MWLFDFFKKNKQPVIKCAQFFREVGETKYWKIEGRQYCQECYNKKMTIIRQLGDDRPKNGDFEMPVDDVFSIKNVGVALTGTIKHGCISVDDTVIINSKEYTVVKIDMMMKGPVTYAEVGDNVGLTIHVLDPYLFKHGDVIFSVQKASETEKVIAVSEFKQEEFIDDITFIRAMKHTPSGPWHQYDILLDARGYGWENMIEWADYMSEADLKNISEVTVGSMGVTSNNITESYLQNGGKCSQTPELSTECSMLSIAGISRVLNAPLKIVWINQTQILSFFTLIDDEALVSRYAETTIRRNFGTKDAMKLGRPIPEGQ